MHDINNQQFHVPSYATSVQLSVHKGNRSQTEWIYVDEE